MNRSIAFCLFLLFLAGNGFAMPLAHLEIMAGDTGKMAVVKKKKPTAFDFGKQVSISQSTATSEQQQQPAQFLLTMPQKGKSSYLIDAGVSVDFSKQFKGFPLATLIMEYHRNTLVDSVQNNFQVGLKGTFTLHSSHSGDQNFYLITTPKYIIDQVLKEHSLASDFLFTFDNYGDGIKWNTGNYDSDYKHVLKPVLLFGTQVQQVFASDTTAPKGFILRPLVTGSLSYAFLRTRYDPAVLLSLTYTQRFAVINQTISRERFTHLFKAGADYFIITQPVKLSIGVAFTDGADPLQGLKQQQYYLVSINVYKKTGK